MWPAMPSRAVGAGVKRKSRSPRLAVNWHSTRIATVRLALVETPLFVVVTVGSAANVESIVHAFEGDFGCIAASATRGHQNVAGDAFARGRSGSKAQVQITAPGGELAQHSHRH